MFKKISLPLIFSLLLLTSCGKDQSVVSQIHERDANTIIVFLQSKGIPAHKVRTSSGEGAGGAPTQPMFDIYVSETDLVDAMAFLNQAGLPRQMGTNLLQLFAKSGLMSTDTEEQIRYQAGLTSEIANMIKMMDGVIDAFIQLSFPKEEVIPGEQTSTQRITAAVYVKHQGILDDPNMHLEGKIKRLVSGSVTGLDINDVTVVSDTARFAEISLDTEAQPINGAPKDYVSIWSVVMSETSASRFRLIFFTLMFFVIVFAIGFAWLVWKVYPILKRKGGMKEVLNPRPVQHREVTHEMEEGSTEE